MVTGLTHFAAAEKLLRDSRGIAADDLEPAQLLSAVLAEAQVHATLALASVRDLQVWWLDDGRESPEPDLYATYAAAIGAGERQFRDDNPGTTITLLGWQLIDERDHDSGSELVVNGHRTGITVHRLRPKAA